jgi:hypothetical protein
VQLLYSNTTFYQRIGNEEKDVGGKCSYIEIELCIVV